MAGRKTKQEEVHDWIRYMKPFLVEVNFVAYRSQVCVLADSHSALLLKLQEHYPGLETNVINQLSAVII